MLKITKKDKELLDKFKESLSEEAYAELERLWSLRDQFTSINEITLPTLVQYVATLVKVTNLTYTMDEASDEELPGIIDAISKLQKVQIAYCKLLKLDEKVKQKSTNKFADLLLK